jgi:hypothetical protein
MEIQPAVQRLKLLEIAELRLIWGQTCGSAPPPPTKRLLLRELAWGIQSAGSGGLDAETRRLLRAAVRTARCEPTNPRRSAKKKPPRRRGKLQTGTKLVRTWQGRKHFVTVLDSGERFHYRGDTYESLTKIAEKITAAHWSGPRFFGLDRVRGTS